MATEHVELPFFSRFIDKVTLLAQARGSDKPDYSDIWRGLAGLHFTVDVLKQRGIEPYQLENELRYLTIFEPGHAVHEKSMLDDVKANEVDMVDKVFEDFMDYVEQQEIKAEDKDTYRDVAARFAEFVGNYATSWNRPGSPFSEDGYFSIMLVQTMLQRFVDGEGQAPDMDLETVQRMGNFMMEQYMNVMDAPLMKLQLVLQQADEGGVIISPQKLVEIVEKLSPPPIKEMLYRAGMAAPRGHEPLFDLPDSEVIDLALAAHDLAKGQRESTVEPGHFLLAALRSVSGQAALKKLGVQDQSKFRAALSEKLWPHLGEQRYRSELTVPKGTVKLLHELADLSDAADTGTLAQIAMLDRLLTLPKLKTALKAAGLTPEKLEKWDAVRETLAAGEKEKEQSKTTPEGLHVPNQQFEDAIEAYGRDLTKLATDGRLPRIAGRDAELRATQTALLQKEKGNAIFLGEAGTGKTAMFEGFAQQVVDGQVPDKLLGARVIELDLAAMNAGAMFRGQFEERLLTIVKGVAERNASGRFPPIVLCVDEIHAALQAGSASGTPDAGELLKPYLARGDVRVLAATTEAEYKKFIASNKPLERRFDPIRIAPPAGEMLQTILATRAPALAAHHGIAIPAELLDRAQQLANRYVHDRYQPARTIDVLDKAAAGAVIAGRSVLGLEDLHGAVAELAKLPVGFVGQTDAGRILGLRAELPKRVVGQDAALAELAQSIITANADLQNPNKPLGVYLMPGPTGVGKTETARALAELLFGSSDALIKIDMNKYLEKHSVSGLIGAPPGYVGYGEEGEFGQVRRRPYSVLLLDEIEKAHPDVYKTLLSVMEDGQLKDGTGHTIDFRNTLILMSSNLGVEAAANARPGIGFTGATDIKALQTAAFEGAIAQHFSPEFRNRITGTLVYNYLEPQHIATLVDHRLADVAARAKARWNVDVVATPEFKAELATKGYDRVNGARPLERLVKTRVVDPLATWLLEQRVEGRVLVPGSTLQLDGKGAPDIVLPAANTATPAAPRRRAPRLG